MNPHDRLDHIRHLCRRRADVEEIDRHLELLEHQVRELLADAAAERARHPAHITISQEGHPMGSYNAGDSVQLFATVTNDTGTAIADNVTWTTDNGTVTTGPASTDAAGNIVETAVLSGASIGTANVFATTSNGISSAVDAITFTDPNAGVPVAVSVTDAPMATG